MPPARPLQPAGFSGISFLPLAMPQLCVIVACFRVGRVQQERESERQSVRILVALQEQSHKNFIASRHPPRRSLNSTVWWGWVCVWGGCLLALVCLRLLACLLALVCLRLSACAGLLLLACACLCLLVLACACLRVPACACLRLQNLHLITKY